MKPIAINLQAVKKRIEAAAKSAGRNPDTINLVGVTKKQPIPMLLQAFESGLCCFGESYAQEAVQKISALNESEKLPEWHFIGPLQSNKTHIVAENFLWVHSIDRLKIAQRLSAQRPLELPALQCCIQVNISGEASKSGCRPEEAFDLCVQVAALPGLQLRGLMSIPAPLAAAQTESKSKSENAIPEASFESMHRLFKQVQLQLLDTGTITSSHCFDTLSMGMSKDFELAIAHGATLIRIGQAIFGPRR